MSMGWVRTRIRIRIRYSQVWIRFQRYGSVDPDPFENVPDPFENVTDPQHWLLVI
jgi:hypothetical protein